MQSGALVSFAAELDTTHALLPGELPFKEDYWTSVHTNHPSKSIRPFFDATSCQGKPTVTSNNALPTWSQKL